MENKSKKRLIISGVILAIIGIVLIPLGLFLMNKSDNKPEEVGESGEDATIVEVDKELDATQKKVQEAAKLFNAYLIDPTKSTIDYEKLTGIQENYFDPMVGKDSDSQYNILNEYPDHFSDDFSDYEEKQQKYADNLASAIKENFDLKLKGAPLYTSDKKQLMQVVEVVPFSYSLYQMDISAVQSELLDMAKIKVKDSLESLPSLYKSRVKAMEVLDSYLSEYKNKKKFETNMIYDIGETITCNNCHFYINYAEGVYLDSVMPEENYEKNKKKRISKMINEATKKGIIDKSNPLKLK